MSAIKTLSKIVVLPIAVIALAFVSCVNFYDKIPCDTEEDCPHGYRCNGICEGPGFSCETDSDCDEYEAVNFNRDLLCVRMPWENAHQCRLSCTPGSSAEELACPVSQDCRSLSDGTNLGACF